MKRKARYFIKAGIDDERPRYLLCNDGKLRDFVWFGTTKSCLKIYRSEGWAIRKAQQLIRTGQAGRCIVHYAYDGETISNRGEITKPQPAIW